MARRPSGSILLVALASLALASPAAADDRDPVYAQIGKQHADSVKKLQRWIHQPTIAATGEGIEEGCALTMQMLRDAGFQHVERIPTDGKPGIFATLDAGAPRTVGVYFMYDVKQVDPKEWSSPPWDAALVDRPGLGKVMIGRGAVNQKGPEMAFLAALHAFKASGRKLPVNLVLVAEGEEEIGSPHFPQVVKRSDIRKALARTTGVFMPSAGQESDGNVEIALGAKGIIEAELVCDGAKWGRGPAKDVHSSNRARLDSPAIHLMQAINTLVSADGNDPAIDGFADAARPLSADEVKMIADGARRGSEKLEKKDLQVKHWVRDIGYREALERLLGKPTVNIEGLVAGYTGPGGKTVLPHRAVAKMDFRLVPNMTAAASLQAIKRHLAKRGFGDIEVNMTGGYDPNSTSLESGLIQAQLSLYKRAGLSPIVWPRSAGSWPGYVFTGAPLKLAAGHFGLGHGSGAHAPDEYYVIQSSNPKVKGFDGAARSFVDYLYELAAR
ncbi:MAG TPA: M20/M25/M40 family metallo-hydrolase [Kofleriaceae bacterium]|nr:M20/M25/M40 family metallo-hydrolase [Kofleriaceae bacterium]